MSEVANKIISILRDSAVDAAFDETKLSDDKNIDRAIKTIKNVLCHAKEATAAAMTANPLYSILGNFNRDKAIMLIDKFCRKYEAFINSTTIMTGRKVIYSHNHYADKTDEFIKADIEFTIYIIYLSALMENGTKALVTRAFKGIIQIFKNDNMPTVDEDKLIKRMESVVKRR
jgi:hypothetical protein